MKSREKTNLLKQIRELQQQIVGITVDDTSCDACIHYSVKGGLTPHCLWFDDAIPENVLLVGCDAWELDDVPF